MPGDQGLLEPLAYAPYNSGPNGGPVIDLLVTGCVRFGSTISFKFYPNGESPFSPFATTVSFILGVNLFAGQFIRLVNNSTDSLMSLVYRSKGAPNFNLAAGASVNIAFSPYSTCYVFVQKESPVCAIGVVNLSLGFPIFPANLLPQYTVTATLANSSSDFVYVQNDGDPIYIPANWTNAWQVIRPTDNWLEAGLVNYAADVKAVEDELTICLLPGQLTAIAFRPYTETVGSVWTAGIWSLLVTSAISPNTIVYLVGNSWASFLMTHDPWFTWTSGANEIPTGTVITFSNLGSEYIPCASVGTIVTSGGLLPDPIVALTAVSVYVDSDRIYTSAGTYTADYDGTYPNDLVFGATIRACLWPSGASIITPSLDCKKECNPTILSLVANSKTLVKWIAQPIPSSYPICIKPCLY